MSLRVVLTPVQHEFREAAFCELTVLTKNLIREKRDISMLRGGKRSRLQKDMRSTHARIKLHKWRPEEEGGLFAILILYRFSQYNYGNMDENAVQSTMVDSTEVISIQ